MRLDIEQDVNDSRLLEPNMAHSFLSFAADALHRPTPPPERVPSQRDGLYTALTLSIALPLALLALALNLIALFRPRSTAPAPAPSAERTPALPKGDAKEAAADDGLKPSGGPPHGAPSAMDWLLVAGALHLTAKQYVLMAQGQPARTVCSHCSWSLWWGDGWMPLLPLLLGFDVARAELTAVGKASLLHDASLWPTALYSRLLRIFPTYLVALLMLCGLRVTLSTTLLDYTAFQADAATAWLSWDSVGRTTWAAFTELLTVQGFAPDFVWYPSDLTLLLPQPALFSSAGWIVSALLPLYLLEKPLLRLAASLHALPYLQYACAATFSLAVYLFVWPPVASAWPWGAAWRAHLQLRALTAFHPYFLGMLIALHSHERRSPLRTPLASLSILALAALIAFVPLCYLDSAREPLLSQVGVLLPVLGALLYALTDGESSIDPLTRLCARLPPCRTYGVALLLLHPVIVAATLVTHELAPPPASLVLGAMGLSALLATAVAFLVQRPVDQMMGVTC